MPYSRKEAFLKKIYGEVLAGKSSRKILDRPVFIKHFSPSEQSLVDDKYVYYFDLAVSSGLATLDDKLKKLHVQGLWEDKDEKGYHDNITFIRSLRESKKHLVLSSQLEAINKEIDDAELSSIENTFKRDILIQLTAEAFTEKKINETYIANSIYTDSACSIPFLSAEEYDDLDGDEFQLVVHQYNTEMQSIVPEYFKKIAISDFFRGLFVLAGDNTHNFYGKPVVSLTHAQAQLFSYGRMFNNILSNSTPDQDYSDNPDGLLDWYHLSLNADKVFNEQGNSEQKVMGYMGATRGDVEKMKGKEAFSVFDTANETATPEAATDKGKIVKKTLSMKELMAM